MCSQSEANLSLPGLDAVKGAAAVGTLQPRSDLFETLVPERG
jgi:hypothetical protein